MVPWMPYIRVASTSVSAEPLERIRTAALITRKNYMNPNEFANDIKMIQYFFGPLEQQDFVGAFPGADSDVPIIVLGSSLASAYVAAELGLMYSFAGHINPKDAEQAIKIYRENFKPSPYLSEPYVILGTWLFAADTDEKAEELFSSVQRTYLDMLSGKNARKKQKVENARPLTSAEKILATKAIGMNVRGSKETVKDQIRQIKERYAPDEIIAVTSISDMGDLRNNYKIFKEAVQEVEA